MRAWRAADKLEARGGAEVVALPDRQQRLLRHAAERAAAGAADGPRPVLGRRRRARRAAARARLGAADRRRARAPPSRPGGARRSRETLRLAFVAALQHLPPRQRAVLILREVLRWQASEVAELLDTSVASVNSALQRARATLEALDLDAGGTAPRSTTPSSRSCWPRYVEAFERYDIASLVTLLHEDATFSMPPFPLWLRGPGRRSTTSCSAPAPTARAPACSSPQPTAARRSAIYHPAPRRLRAVGDRRAGDLRRADLGAAPLPLPGAVRRVRAAARLDARASASPTSSSSPRSSSPASTRSSRAGPARRAGELRRGPAPRRA